MESLPSTWISNGTVTEANEHLILELLKRSLSTLGTPHLALWLVSEQALHPVLAHGCLDGRSDLEQTLSEGIISFVFQSGQALCVSDSRQEERYSAHIDQELKHETGAMVVVPITVDCERVGILSAVHLKHENGDAEFSISNLHEMQFLATCIGRLIESDLLKDPNANR